MLALVLLLVMLMLIPTLWWMAQRRHGGTGKETDNEAGARWVENDWDETKAHCEEGFNCLEYRGRRLRGVTEGDQSMMQAWRTSRGYEAQWDSTRDLLVKGDVRCPFKLGARKEGGTEEEERFRPATCGSGTSGTAAQNNH